MYAPARTPPLCLRGSVVREDGSVSPRQHVLVSDGRIQSITSSKPSARGLRTYELAADELLFPALLDLHTHTTYNLLPLWDSPYWAWDNRFQWRANADYKKNIGQKNREILSEFGHGSKGYQAFAAFSELIAVAGGTTVLQENDHLDRGGFPSSGHVLIRSTGHAPDLGLGEDDRVASVLEFYEPGPYGAPRTPPQDSSHWEVKEAAKGARDGATYVADFAGTVARPRTRGTIVHVAEGRSGFLQTKRGPDAYTRGEFDAFRAFLTRTYRGDEIEAVRKARLALVHGCGMDTVTDAKTTKATVKFLRDYGVGVVWSPVSNLLLYQDTTNVMPLLEGGVPVALGTDWSPSGSKHVWEEAKFARFFLDRMGWKGDAARVCFQAVTSVPADLLGAPLGRIKKGNLADLLILRRPRGVRPDDALGAFYAATDRDVRAVLVGGRALYGDRDALAKLGSSGAPLPDEPGARTAAGVLSQKVVSFPSDGEISVDALASMLEVADRVLGSRRPKLLVVDDPFYRSRMDRLRSWVVGFKKRGPSPAPTPPAPTGLAPGEQEWMYNPSLDEKSRMPDDVRVLLGEMAPCRDARCAVPKLHPYYHAEVLAQAGDAYGFRVPCMPVVPILTNRQQLFVMGDYPTAKFTARSSNNLPVITDEQQLEASLAATEEAVEASLDGPSPLPSPYHEELSDIVRGIHEVPSATAQPSRFGKAPAKPRRTNNFFVPVGDVFAPMQDASYFDGYKVRNVAAGVFFQQNYLRAVGVDLETQVWLTNMIKCFLFHQSMVDSYQSLGWTDVRVEESYSQLLPVARVCKQWIEREVEACRPKLVLTVGKPPCTLLHGIPEKEASLQGRVYNALLGVLLPPDDPRIERGLASELRGPAPTPKSPEEPGKKPRASKKPAEGKVSPDPAATAPPPPAIVRGAPWSKYGVFHMLHPQAVMMSQTGIAEALQQASAYLLGAKGAGRSRAELQRAAEKVSVHDLVPALPPGQRDAYEANAKLLETHAVSLADLADALVGLGLTKAPTGPHVLEAQAKELTVSFRLADSWREELDKLARMRAEKRKRVDGYLKRGG